MYMYVELDGNFVSVIMRFSVCAKPTKHLVEYNNKDTRKERVLIISVLHNTVDVCYNALTASIKTIASWDFVNCSAEMLYFYSHI